MHCKLLSKDLLNRRFRGKSHQEVGTMAKQPSGERPQRNRKTSFGKLVNGEIKKSFRSGKLAIAPLKIPKFALVSSLA